MYTQVSATKNSDYVYYPMIGIVALVGLLIRKAYCQKYSVKPRAAIHIKVSDFVAQMNLKMDTISVFDRDRETEKFCTQNSEALEKWIKFQWKDVPVNRKELKNLINTLTEFSYLVRQVNSPEMINMYGRVAGIKTKWKQELRPDKPPTLEAIFVSLLMLAIGVFVIIFVHKDLLRH